MTKILIVTGSARLNSVNSKIVKLIEHSIDSQPGTEAHIADLGQINLPFYDGVSAPSADGFEISNLSAKKWSDLVSSADAVVFVSPEYNHGLSGLQKNAIDWLYREWTDKPVLFVAYGWYAGAYVLSQLHEIGKVVKWKSTQKTVGLRFMQDIDLEGNILDDSANQEITHALAELTSSI